MLIGMPEADKGLGISRDRARRALLRAGVPLIRINTRTLAVEEKDLEAFMAARANDRGKGRPRKPPSGRCVAAAAVEPASAAAAAATIPSS
jgi:hypothetical protein